MNDVFYILELNDMRSPKIEHLRPAVWAWDPGALDRMLEESLPERVTCERGYHHNYPEGHPLHWFNKPYTKYEANVRTSQDRMIREQLPEAK